MTSSPLSSPSPSASSSAAGALRLLFLGMLCVNVGTALLIPVLPSLVRGLSLSEVQAGAIMTSSAVMLALASPVWGRLSDRWGRKPVLVVGLVGFGLGFLAFAGIAHGGLAFHWRGLALFLVLLAARAAIGAMYAAVPAAGQAYVADICTPDERTRAMGMLAAASGLGVIVGPALGAGISALLGGLIAPFYAAGVFGLIGAALVAARLPVAPRQIAAENGVKLSVRDPRVWPVLLVGLSLMISLAVSQITAGFYFQDRMHLDATGTTHAVAIAMTACGLALLTAQVGVVQRAGWSPTRLLRLGLPLVTLASALVLLPWGLPGYAFTFAVMGFGYGLSIPAFNTAATWVVEAHEQGAMAGLTGIATGVGFMAGPLVGTLLYQWRIEAAFAAAAGLLALVSVLVWRHSLFARLVQGAPAGTADEQLAA